MITVEHLTKCYGGFTAVEDLSFTIQEGHVYGFLGPNGAGKSTTMNMMTGCLSATDGHISIYGHDIFEEPEEAKRLIGYLPEQPPLYMNESPVEYLHFVGRAKGLAPEELTEQLESVIEQTRLGPVRHKRISTLSKGYKQRVGIAQALLGNPKVIVLDEPTVGLDPLQIIEIRDLIKELGQTHTVIFSSHILSEVQAICDQVLIINKGRLIAFDAPDQLEKQLLTPNEIRLTTDAPAQELRRMLAKLSDRPRMEIHTGVFTTAELHSSCADIYELSRTIFRIFSGSRYDLLELSLKKANLEDIFLELTEDKSVRLEPLAWDAAKQAEGEEETE